MTGRPRIVALVSAYNEEDIVDQVVANLIAEGVEVYFLDDGSTDGTRRLVEARIGRGVIAIEALRGPGEAGEFSWTSILARKEALAQELDADWFIHHDADEFRESPWPGLRLADAVARVDRAGYNAIDFALFDFWPTNDNFTPGQDIRHVFRHYEPPQWWNKLQIKCWKKGAAPVDLILAGGHEAVFPGRRVYPLRFVLRHYPIRGTAHGHRKVFDERLPRFASAERAHGWHRQYDEFLNDQAFIRDRSRLRPFEPVAARFEIATEDLQRIDEAREEATKRALTLRGELDCAADELARLAREVSALDEELRASRLDRERLHHALAELTAAHQRLRGELDGLHASRTWRWSRPIRQLLARLLPR